MCCPPVPCAVPPVPRIHACTSVSPPSTTLPPSRPHRPTCAHGTCAIATGGPDLKTAFEQTTIGMFGYMTNLSEVELNDESRSLIEVDGTGIAAVDAAIPAADIAAGGGGRMRA